MSTTKNCKNCQIEKPISEFSTQKSRGKEYVNNICLSCMSHQQKEYRETNKEEKRKRDKDYYEKVKNTPEFTESNKNIETPEKKRNLFMISNIGFIIKKNISYIVKKIKK